MERPIHAGQAEAQFFHQEDSTKMDRFVLIPKALLSSPDFKSVPLRAKLAYSFYLGRYNGTRLKDAKGPYIIFSDDDLALCLDTNIRYAGRVRQQLVDAHLIRCDKTTRGNRIRVLPYVKSESDNTLFFTEQDMSSMRFVRFPVRLLDEEFAEIDIKIRMYYAMLFDMMCLSQANYFADERGHLYFQITLEDQAKRFDISRNTLTRYKAVLEACGLLYEYLPYGKPIRYYLMKLDAYVNRVDEFYNMTLPQQQELLSEINGKFKKTYIESGSLDAMNVKALKAYFDSIHVSAKKASEIYTAEAGKALSAASMRKYLNGSRKMKPEVYDFFVNKYGLQGTMNSTEDNQNVSDGTKWDTVSQKSADGNDTLSHGGTQFPNFVSSDSQFCASSFPNKCSQIPKKVQSITYTEDNNTDINTLNHTKTELAGWDELSKSLFSAVKYMADSFTVITSEDMDMISDCLLSSTHEKSIIITDSDQKKEVAPETIAQFIRDEFLTDHYAERRVLKILNDFSKSGAATNFRRTKSYIRTAFFNMFYSLGRHPYLAEKYVPSMMVVDIYKDSKPEYQQEEEFSDEIKNYDIFAFENEDN